jgi:energy-coupling factor transport system permease protein
MPRYSDLFLGRYSPGKSHAHRLDTRLKVLMIGVYSVAIWSVDTFTGLGVMCLVVAAWAAAARGALRQMLAGVRSLGLISVLVLLYYWWSGAGPADGSWQVALGGAALRTVFLMGKIGLLLLAASWFYLYTPPMKVVDALAALLGPLKRLHFPVREFSFTVGLVLRFFPEAVVRIGEFYRQLQFREALAGQNKTGRGRQVFRVVRRVVDTMVLYMHYSLYGSELLAVSLLARGYNPFRENGEVRFPAPSAWELWLFVLSTAAILAAAALL